MNKKYTNVIIGFAVVIVVIAVIWVWTTPAASQPVAPEITSLAQCLTDKGVVMYGAEWCSHCQDQKKLFGDAWQKITYIECPDDPALCTQKGVTGYPTWILADGRQLAGEQSFSQLAGASGCELGL